MLIKKLGTKGRRYLPVTELGGYWNWPGGYWEASETRYTRHFDLMNQQVNTSRRVLAGIGGCSFEVFTSETSVRTDVHTFADPRFSIPANTRHASDRLAHCSHDVTTEAGAR
jgi:hypothetical protein